MSDKSMKPLIPPDRTRCQALIHNGATFVTVGGRPGYDRYTAKPSVIATETQPGSDGRIGSMSLCEKCKVVFVKQMGEGFATFKVIKPTRHKAST